MPYGISVIVGHAGLDFRSSLPSGRPIKIPLFGDIATALSAARDRGLKELNTIAEEEAASRGLTQPQCLDYLAKNLNFILGPRERTRARTL